MSILSVGAKHVTKALAKEAVPEVIETAAKTAVKTAPDVAPKAVATNLDFLTKGRTKKQILELKDKYTSYGFNIDDPEYLEAGLPQSIKNAYDNAAGGDWSSLTHADQLEAVDRMYGNGAILDDIVQEHGERTIPPPIDPVEALRANYAPREPEEAIESLRSIAGQTKWGRTERTIQGPVPPRLADKTFDQGAKSWEEAIMANEGGTTKFMQNDDPMQARNYGSATAPRGRTITVGKRKTTGRGITKEGNTRKINEELATADWITPEEKTAFGKAMAKAASEGMDGDHIIEVARVANAVKEMIAEGASPERIESYFRLFEKVGIHLGNHPKNVQQLSKKVNQEVKPAQLRAIDNALKNMDKRSKSLLNEIIFSPKAKPTQFPKQIQDHIARSQEIGIPEPVWKSGSIDYTWRPETNTGQIDIPPQSAKGFKGLRDEFFEQIEELPSGSVWELNPKFKDEKRRRIYARLFGNDPRITRNPDETLGWVLTIP